ncbi:MAG: hypothetical protein JO322_07670 [Candidatus Eremiobacteraeota bacterium]|nr:hypothetical protein [Candidatus Eremiobacteraeota bacterium]
MKRTLLTIATAAAVVVASAGYGAATAAAPPAKATAAPKDACSSVKSKFAHDQCESFNHSAPGDEYFGRMKMSYLGINNTFHDEYIRAGDYTTDANVINKVNFADEALQAWAQKYPGDPQLARSYYLAIRMYRKIYIRTYQDKAWQYMHTLTSPTFASTYFGKLEKTEMAKGFTEHYFANAQLCPTPEPTATPGPPSKRPTPTPSPTPTPEPTPTPTPTPSPRPGQPKVEVIQPPCVQPSPLEESPTPAPSNFPSPAATPTTRA